MTNTFLSKWREVLLLSATFLFLLFAQTSCKKKNSFSGENALDPDELLSSSATDTFSLFTYTIQEDSIVTSNSSYNVLGKYNDPKFGTFDASFYTQFRLSGVNPQFGNPSEIAIDSLILGMQYAGSYGDISAMDIGVYELTESLHLDSNYYAFTDKSVQFTDLVDHSNGPIIPNISKKTIVGPDTIAPQIRIPLDTNFARQLIVEAMSGSGTFASNESFLNYFKGFKVSVNDPMPGSGSGGILYFNNTVALSKMTIYYRINGEAKKFDFLINAECADFNHVETDNSGTDVQNVIDDSTAGQMQFYTQAFNARAVIKIPGLSNLPPKTIVHSAKLILPVESPNSTSYPISGTINVFTKERATDNFYVFSNITATYDPFRRAYILDLRDHLQRINYGILENTGVYITPQLFTNSAERIIFNGVNSTNKTKPELIIKYTEF